jgi:hypothetical protein
MTTKAHDEDVFEPIWSLILIRVTTTLASRYGLLFFLIPLLGLLPPLESSLKENRLTTDVINFFFWYFPFLFLSFGFFRGANPAREKPNSKRYDQAVLIIWGYNRVISILFSVLLLNFELFWIDKNYSSYIEEKSDVLIWYLVFALVVFIFSICFRDKILHEKANQISGKSETVNLEKVIFSALIFISLVISFILFPLSQNNPKWVFAFSLGIVGSLITFFIGIIGFYELVVIWNWRKKAFWDKKTTS